MKVIFMGTPDFAVNTLEALYEAGHEVGFVVSQPDAAKDRGKKVKHTPVKEKAMELGIPVLQPEKIKNNLDFFTKIEEYNPDVIVVVAYGKILPKELLQIPKFKCINVHGSLLPKYRGAAPIQRAILDGQEKTGITIMYMEEGLDTGDMLAKKETPIAFKNAEDLHNELAQMGAELLVETLAKFKEEPLVGERQDDSMSSYAPMIFKKDGEIDFSKSAREIECQIRAFCPWPGAYTQYAGQTLKVWNATVIDEKTKTQPGTIVNVSNEGVKVSCGRGQLLIKVIQLPGKKKVEVKDYLRGNKIEINGRLG